MAERLEAADHDDGRDRDAELAPHAAEHDDGEDDRQFMKVKISGLMKPWRVAKNEPAKPPNIAPVAKAVSLVMVVLMPSERQAISSSRIASQARPIGSRRSLRVTRLVMSASDEDHVIEEDDAVQRVVFEAEKGGESWPRSP